MFFFFVPEIQRWRPMIGEHFISWRCRGPLVFRVICIFITRRPPFTAVGRENALRVHRPLTRRWPLSAFAYRPKIFADYSAAAIHRAAKRRPMKTDGRWGAAWKIVESNRTAGPISGRSASPRTFVSKFSTLLKLSRVLNVVMLSKKSIFKKSGKIWKKSEKSSKILKNQIGSETDFCKNYLSEKPDLCKLIRKFSWNNF